MARVINDTCISCGTCAASCPVEAISQGDAQYRATLSTRSTQIPASIAVLARVHVL